GFFAWQTPSAPHQPSVSEQSALVEHLSVHAPSAHRPGAQFWLSFASSSPAALQATPTATSPTHESFWNGLYPTGWTAHWPSLPHVSHSPSQAVLQQMPPTQLPDAQSAPTTQVPPSVHVSPRHLSSLSRMPSASESSSRKSGVPSPSVSTGSVNESLSPA